uniref:PesH n=1 Tax=Pestalotiopsis humus TaxID=1562279 RepID=A0A6M4EMR7_9PEZI|nr:PesH [Pestalotiopsis humus]
MSLSSKLEADALYEATLRGTFARQFTTPKPLPSGTRLDGQTVLVTGGNGGIGLAACRELLKLGPSQLILAARSRTRGEEAAQELRQEFAASSILISVWTLDMESYESIQKFAEQCAALPRIDIVILNAALMKQRYDPHPITGHEMTIQVNYLSTALLAILLLPILKASKAKNESSQPPVLHLVASETAYYEACVPKPGPVLPQYQDPKAYDTFSWYSASKLLLILFGTRLAELVDPNDVLINMSTPGLTRSSRLDGNVSAFMKVLMRVFRSIVGRTQEVAASVYLHAVLAAGAASHGSYISDWTIKPYPKFWFTAEGQKARAALWEETMTELNFAGVSKIINDIQRVT